MRDWLESEENEPFEMYVEIPRRTGDGRWSVTGDDMYRFERVVPVPQVGDLVTSADDCAYPVQSRQFGYALNMVTVTLYLDQPVDAEGGDE